MLQKTCLKKEQLEDNGAMPSKLLRKFFTA